LSSHQDQIAVSTNQARPAEIEQVLEQIGARYIADLRILSEKFSQFYGTFLAEKDTQITQLGRSVEAIEHERDAYRAQVIAQNAQIAQLIEHAEMTKLELAERDTQSSRHHFVAMYQFVGAQYHRAKLLPAANKSRPSMYRSRISR